MSLKSWFQQIGSILELLALGETISVGQNVQCRELIGGDKLGFVSENVS